MSSRAEAVARYRAIPTRRVKQAFVQGKPTGGFKRWADKEVKAGRMTWYPDAQNRVYNPETQRFNRLERRQDGTLRASSQRKVERFAPRPEVISVSSAGPWELYRHIKSHNLQGNYQLFIRKGGEMLLQGQDIVIPAVGRSTWYNAVVYYKLMADSDTPVWENGEAEVMLVRSRSLHGVGIPEQLFADNERNNCILAPILAEAESHPENRNWVAIRNKLIGKINKKSGRRTQGLFDKYPDGVPKSALAGIAESLAIGIDIYVPLQEEPLVSVRPTNGSPRKVFQYVNTRHNHVEATDGGQLLLGQGENVSREQIDEKWRECVRRKIPMVYRKDGLGVGQLSTLEGSWNAYDEEFTELLNEWTRENGLQYASIDAAKHPHLVKFLRAGCHFNMTRDFQRHEGDIEELGHIDLRSAYTKFMHCADYEGFPRRISDYRETTQIRGLGYYRITNIDMGECVPRLRWLNHHLKWLREGVVYFSPELKKFQSYGVKFDITHGAWGDRIDFDMDADWWMEKTDVAWVNSNGTSSLKRIPRYCKAVGCWARTNTTVMSHMVGSQELFEHMAATETGTKAEMLITDTPYGQELTMRSKKMSAPTRVHIAGGITGYMRMNMLDQLMMMREDKIVRICTDGIYYHEHSFPILTIFANKDKKTLNNGECESYLSNEAVPDDDDCLPTAKDLPHHKDSAKLGVGGGAKTEGVGADRGLIDVSFITISRKAASSVRERFPGCKAYVYWDIMQNPELLDKTRIREDHGVVAFDEISSVSWVDLQWLKDNFKGKRMYIGDPGYQTRPFASINGGRCVGFEIPKSQWGTFFDHHTIATHSYRIQCETLRDVNNHVRDLIDTYGAMNDTGVQLAFQYIKERARTAARDDTGYVKEDMILVSTRKLAKEWTDRFSDIVKYRVTRNKGIHYNGDTVFEKPDALHKQQHGFTIHSVQGDTIHPPSRVFIDERTMRDLTVVYTAISRARLMSQVIVVVAE